MTTANTSGAGQTNHPAKPESWPLPWRKVPWENDAESNCCDIEAANGKTVLITAWNDEADRILAAVNNPAVNGLVEACTDLLNAYASNIQHIGGSLSTNVSPRVHALASALAAYRASIGGGSHV